WQAGAIVKWLLRRLATTFGDVPETVEWLKCTGLGIFQDDPCPRHPVGALTIDQVTDDIECAPGISAFIALSPGIGKFTEKCIEYRRSAFENCDGVRQVELCSVSHGCVDVRRR